MGSSDPEPPLTPELLTGYCDAIVTVADPDERLLVDASHDRGPLWTVTAYNPYSVPRPDTVNVRRQVDLQAEVDRSGWTSFPATGSSPDGSWSEPGLALAGVSEEQALALGREWGQHALYLAVDGVLWVVECSTGRHTRCDGGASRTGRGVER